jgi:hypothetical protein
MIFSDLASPAEAGFAKAGNRFGIMRENLSNAEPPMLIRRAPARKGEGGQVPGLQVVIAAPTDGTFCSACR